MAREKATITVDRQKVEAAKAIIGVTTMSDVIDVALTRLLAVERLRADIAAYRETPPTPEEGALASISPDWSEIEDDTDWNSLYPETA
jgi:hypothetical protein